MTERDDLKETAKTTMTDAGIERSLSNLLGIQMPKSLAQTIWTSKFKLCITLTTLDVSCISR